MTYATYADYLRSPVWAAIRLRILARAGERCQACNSPHALEVHHRVYDGAWGEEDEADLIVLCSLCHGLITAWLARSAEIIAGMEERMGAQVCGACRQFAPDRDIAEDGECWRLHPVFSPVSRDGTCIFWEAAPSEKGMMATAGEVARDG